MTHRPKSRDPKKDRHRSRITNGRGRLLEGIDGRSGLARRYRDIAQLIMADQGGYDNITQARYQLIRRFAAHCVEAEVMEARMCRGDTYDIAEHAHISSTLVRIAARLGLRRRLKEVPNLADYLAAAGFQGHDDPQYKATVDEDLAEDLATMRGEYVHAKDGNEEELPDKVIIDGEASNSRTMPIRRALQKPDEDHSEDSDPPGGEPELARDPHEFRTSSSEFRDSSSEDIDRGDSS
jgi:hypothetical protein